MRLLNRSAGRLSRHRRGPLAGLAVLLLALLLTGGAYSLLSPGAQAERDQHHARPTSRPAASCSWSAAPSATATNGEGVPTRDGGQYGPALDRRRRAPPSTSRSAPAGCRWPSPASRPCRKPPVFDEDEIRQLAAYVDSLGTGPAVPDESAYTLPDDLTEEERDEAITRGGQIFLTNCTACHNFDGSGGAMPRGGQAPTLRGVDSRYIYEALLTGPQQMPSFSDGNLTPEAKRDVIAYLKATEETPGYGGFGLGSLGPVSEGLFAWLVGIGGLVGFAIWIAAHTTRTTKAKPPRPAPVNLPPEQPATPRAERPRERPRQAPRRRRARRPPAGRPRGADRQPGPAGPHVASDRRRRGRSPSAPSARSRCCSRSRRCAPCCSSSPTSSSTSATTGTPSAASAPPPSPSGVFLGLALMLIGVGIIQWARKLMADHEMVEMRHPAALLRRGPRRHRRGAQRRPRGVRPRPSAR